jgi:spore maturation protein SpmA
MLPRGNIRYAPLEVPISLKLAIACIVFLTTSTTLIPTTILSVRLPFFAKKMMPVWVPMLLV